MALPRFRITERQVLLWIMACLFLAYAAMFLVAYFRKNAEPVVIHQPPRVRRMASTASGGPDVRYWFAETFDPSLLALPSLQGFSCRLWRGGPVAELTSGDWNIRPAFLRLPQPDGLAMLLEQPALTQVVENLAEKLPATETSTNAAPAFVTVTNSYLSVVNGTLAGRDLLSRLSLPVVTNETPLRSTRVRVAVSPDGTVQFANLERSCGNETVDAQAVSFCQQLQFAPLTGNAGKSAPDLLWGVVRFAWATIPPPHTNGIAKPATPSP